MTYYKRNLPHWHPNGENIFVTWRLYGSLPADFVHSLKVVKGVNDGKKFRALDTELDKGLDGPIWLKDPRVARCVEDTIRRGEREWEYYVVHAYVVMVAIIAALLPLRIGRSS